MCLRVCVRPQREGGGGWSAVKIGGIGVGDGEMTFGLSLDKKVDAWHN